MSSSFAGNAAAGAGAFSFWSSTLIRLESCERVDIVPKDGARLRVWPRPCIVGELKDSDRFILGTVSVRCCGGVRAGAGEMVGCRM